MNPVKINQDHNKGNNIRKKLQSDSKVFCFQILFSVIVSVIVSVFSFFSVPRCFTRIFR